VIEEQEFRGGFVTEGISQLLDDQTAGGMPGDIAVNNLPPVVPNNIKEAVQQLNRPLGR